MSPTKPTETDKNRQKPTLLTNKTDEKRRFVHRFLGSFSARALERNPRPCSFGLGTHRVRWTWSDQRSLTDGTTTRERTLISDETNR